MQGLCLLVPDPKRTPVSYPPLLFLTAFESPCLRGSLLTAANSEINFRLCWLKTPSRLYKPGRRKVAYGASNDMRTSKQEGAGVLQEAPGKHRDQ